MLGHLKFIPQAHQLAMEAALRSHVIGTGINPVLLGNLYEAALTGLTKPVQEADFYTSTFKTEDALVSTATSKTTGVYIQLAQFTGQSTPFLTLGQKWCMEGHNQTLGNNAIAYW
jgi:hypothetical protein